MAESLCQLAKFIVEDTVLLPGLLAFSIGARSSLKTWLAVQETPAAPRLSKEQEKKLKRKMMLVMFTASFSILGFELYLFSQGNKQSIDRFFIYFFAYVYQLSLSSVFVGFTSALKWAAHRAPAGILHFRPVKGTISHPRIVAALFLATTLNVSAYYNLHWTLGSALVVSVVVAKLSTAPARNFSLRWCILGLLIFVSFLTTFSGVMILTMIKLDQDKKSLQGGEEYSKIEEVDVDDMNMGFASPKVMKYVSYFIKAMYIFFPGITIAGCFRFDHSKAVSSSPEIYTLSTPLETSPIAPSTSSKSSIQLLSDGIILPTSIPNSFPKPYYTTSLWSWLIAQFLTIALLYTSLPIPQSILESGIYEVTSFFISSLTIVVGLVGVSLLRGEFKEMWKYKETWIPKSDQGIVLEDGQEDVINKTSSEEEEVVHVAETLPAYGDQLYNVKAAVSEEEGAPAYDVDRKV